MEDENSKVKSTPIRIRSSGSGPVRWFNDIVTGSVPGEAGDDIVLPSVNVNVDRITGFENSNPFLNLGSNEFSGEYLEVSGLPDAYIINIIDPDNGIAVRANNAIKFVLENAALLGIEDVIKAGGGQSNEQIIFALRDNRGDGRFSSDVVGYYNDGDDNGVDGYDEITLFVDPDSKDADRKFFDYVSTVIHEIFHRSFASHDYANVFGYAKLFNSDGFVNVAEVENLANEYKPETAANDETYRATRNALVAAVDAGLLFDPDDPELKGSALRSKLRSDDIISLQAKVDTVNVFRQTIAWVLIQDQKADSGGTGLEIFSIAALQKLAADGERVVRIKEGRTGDSYDDFEVATEAELTAGGLGSAASSPKKVGDYLEGLGFKGFKTHGGLNRGFNPFGNEFPTNSVSTDLSVVSLVRDNGFGVTLVGSQFDVHPLHGRVANGNFEIDFDLSGGVTAYRLNGTDIYAGGDTETRAYLSQVANIIKGTGGDVTKLIGADPFQVPVSILPSGDPSNPDYEFTLNLSVFRRDGVARFSTDERQRAVVTIRKKDVDGVIFTERETVFDGGARIVTDRSGNTSIRLKDSPVGFDFVDVGGLLGSTLGRRIAGDNELVSVVSSAALKTVGQNLGDIFNETIFGSGSNTDENIGKALSSIDGEFLANLKSAGLGAVSSFLTAELVNALGVDGFAGEALNSGAGAIIGQVLSNIAGIGDPANIFSGVDLALVGNAIGSFLGTKLAQEVISFDTIGGQIGSAVGSSLGSIAAAKLLGDTFAFLGVAGGPLGVAIGAFAGFILGGLIGSVFGGTPRSGADVSWDEGEGRFVTANIYSRKGGSREAAEGLATTVAETFNAVLDATGGRLANPGDITTGNYGMRKSDYVYRPTSTRDKRAITFRVDSGDEGAFEQITGYGIWQGLTDPDFQIVGGSNYVKRAVYATFEIGGMSATNFDQSVLLGNIASAQAYESYLANSAVINAIVAAESDSVFAAETAINLARAVELGLTKRHRADWFGGYNALIEEAGTSAASMEFGFDYDPFSDQISRLIGVGDQRIWRGVGNIGKRVGGITAVNDNGRLDMSECVNRWIEDLCVMRWVA